MSGYGDCKKYEIQKLWSKVAPSKMTDSEFKTTCVKQAPLNSQSEREIVRMHFLASFFEFV